MSEETRILTIEEFVANAADIVNKVKQGESLGFEASLFSMPVVVKMFSSLEDCPKYNASYEEDGLSPANFCEDFKTANKSNATNTKHLKDVIRLSAGGETAILNVDDQPIWFSAVAIDLKPS